MAKDIATILQRNPPQIRVNHNLVEAQQMMQQQQLDFLVVMQGKQPLGLLYRENLTPVNDDIQTSTLQPYISTHAVAYLELATPLHKAFDFMFEHHLRQLVIANELGELEGLLELDAILNCAHETKEEQQWTLPDIAKYKQLEQESLLLKVAINTIPDGIFITDSNGVIEYVNHSFAHMMGYEENEAIGKTADFLNSGKQSDSFYTQLWKNLKQGKPWSGRIESRRKDGTIFPVYMSIVPLLNGHHEATHFIAIHEDLTSDEALQRKIIQAQKMEAITTMVGGIAHDFNNLLATVLGNLYLMRKSSINDPKGIARIEVMEKAVHHGAEMIQQMLTFARQDSPDMQQLNILRFLKEAAKLAEKSLPESIHFSLDYNTNIQDIQISGNLQQLQQVIINLIHNAKDATAETEHPSITLSLTQEDPNSDALLHYTGNHQAGEWLCLRCTDNGCGIAEQYLDQIFDPFFTTKGVGEGTGLGLAMVYGAIQNHHGLITVASQVEHGTSMSIYLPILKAKPTQVVQSADQHEMQGQGQYILIVDDDDALRNILDEILSEIGFHVLQAKNGQEAIQIFTANQKNISLIIMDVVMPIMGGVAAAQQIRRMHDDVPIIFQTGYGEQTQLDAGNMIEQCDTLQKPLQVQELLEIIQEKLHADDA